MSNVDTTRIEELTKSGHALAICHNLISNGLFQGSGAKEITLALNFLESLHKQVVAELDPMLDAQATEADEAKVVEATIVEA